MKPLSLKEIAAAIGADSSPDGSITDISTDSRSLPKGCLFIALEGEIFDGHDYIGAALDSGAAFAIAHKQGSWDSSRVLYVKNTGKALLDIAALYRSKFDIKLVGITGSVGKTTTKEMIYAVLSSQYQTLKTQANLNNQIGMPKTLLALEETHGAAVLEMGMSGFGEIEELSLCAKPDIGVITWIGVSHMEQLGSREGILQAKLELTRGLPDGAPLILCGDNDLLSAVRDERLQVIFFGLDPGKNDVTAQEMVQGATNTAFTICYNRARYAAEIPCIGQHNVLDALAAFTVGVCAGIEPQKAAAALSRYRSEGMRQKMVQMGGVTIVEDCYNASPDSMRAAMHTLSEMEATGRKIAVVSDMLELGEIAISAHEETGRYIASLGIDMLFGFGELTSKLVNAAKTAGMRSAYCYYDKERLLVALHDNIRPGDAVWFKASRGMKLEEAVQAVYKELEKE